MNRMRLFSSLAGLGILGCLALTGCHVDVHAGPLASVSGDATTASPDAGVSVPGTHKSATLYRISSPVSTVVVISHVGNITVTGGSGSSTSVTEQATYSKTPPHTTRTISGKTLTVTYSCPSQLVCAVAYAVKVPRGVTVRTQASAGAVTLSGLAGNATATAKVGIIYATGLSGSAVSLTADGGGISASFTAPPATLRAIARVGTVDLHVPGTVAYKVSANAHVGHADVRVRQSSSSGHVITATTDVGSIKVSTTT
jgi:hypothetical protein